MFSSGNLSLFAKFAFEYTKSLGGEVDRISNNIGVK